jgi:hypothetical protein
MLGKQPAGGQTGFKDSSKLIQRGKDVVKEFRDDVGANVRLQAVREALDELVETTDAYGFLEIGGSRERTYFKFAGPLVSMVMSRGVPNAQKFEAYSKKMTIVA